MEALSNSKLSWAAKGLYYSVLNLPEDTKITLEFLGRMTRNGPTATRSAMQELMDNGYLEKIKIPRNDGMPNTTGWKFKMEIK